MSLPRIIALCGNPMSGKTTAAELLQEIYGYWPADDGKPLRQIAIDYFGLTADQVYTQEGKLERVALNDRVWQVREVLGELGNAFEDKFGGDIIPLMSFNTILEGLKNNQRYAFASVRREQGLFWRNHGALVLEIVNPQAGPSKFEFDTYNPAHCHFRIQNDGLARGLDPWDARQDLAGKLVSAVEAFRG